MKSFTISGASLELAGNTVLALSGCALAYYLYYLRPVGYVYFISEDYWAEYTTFVTLFAAFCILTWTLFKDRDARKPGVILLAIGTFFVTMEEISWGQRILGFRPPQSFVANNLQGEMNLHNFIFINTTVRLSFWNCAATLVIPLGYEKK